jgi:hypothetical protein
LEQDGPIEGKNTTYTIDVFEGEIGRFVQEEIDKYGACKIACWSMREASIRVLRTEDLAKTSPAKTNPYLKSMAETMNGVRNASKKFHNLYETHVRVTVICLYNFGG